MGTSLPNWSTSTRIHHNKRVQLYSASLKGVALHLASLQGLDTTAPIHVDHAHEALAKAGLTRAKFYRRPEFEVGSGSMLFAIALASTALGPHFFPESAKVATAIMMCVGGVAGLFFSIHGWMRGNAPPVLLATDRRRRWLCWPWSACTGHSGATDDAARQR